MIQLVACDIDGTLLHGDETELSPDVIKEIKGLKEKNIMFCPTSWSAVYKPSEIISGGGG